MISAALTADVGEGGCNGGGGFASWCAVSDGEANGNGGEAKPAPALCIGGGITHTTRQGVRTWCAFGSCLSSPRLSSRCPCARPSPRANERSRKERTSGGDEGQGGAEEARRACARVCSFAAVGLSGAAVGCCCCGLDSLRLPCPALPCPALLRTSAVGQPNDVDPPRERTEHEATTTQQINRKQCGTQNKENNAGT
jgi:hypothetical protein